MERPTRILSALLATLSPLFIQAQQCYPANGSGPYPFIQGLDHIYRSYIFQPDAYHAWGVSGAGAYIVGPTNQESAVIRVPNGGTVSVSCTVIDFTGNYIGPSFAQNMNVMTEQNNSLVTTGPDTVVAGVASNFTFEYYNNSFGSSITTEYYLTHEDSIVTGFSTIWNSLNIHTIPLVFSAASSSGWAGIAQHHLCSLTQLEKYHFYVLGALLGPATGCVGSTSSFTLPMGTVTNWSVTGGLIVAGQGTNTVSVLWSSSGTQTLSCTWSHGSWGTHTTTRTIETGSTGPVTVNGPLILCNGMSPTTYSVVNPLPGHRYKMVATGGAGQQTVGTSLTIRPTSSAPIVLTVRDSIGDCGTATTINISNSIPFSSMTLPGSVCVGTIVTPSIIPVPGATYTWQCPGGTILSGQGTNSVQVQMNARGNFPVVCSLNVSGCTNSIMSNIDVYGRPPVDFGPDIDICASALTLPLFIGDAHIQGWGGWQPTYACNGLGCSSYISILQPDTFVIIKSLNYPALTCTSTDTVIVSAPTPAVALGPDTSVCAASHLLDPGPHGLATPVSYLWSTGATTPSITVAASGTYIVTSSSPGYCDGIDTITVTLTPAFTPNLTSLPSIACPSQSFTLGTTTPYTTYSWNTGSTQPSITISPPGVFGVTVTHPSGCTGSDTIFFAGYPPPSLILGNDTTICPDTFATPQSAPFVSYAWSTGDTTQSIVALPQLYAITVTDMLGCVWDDTIRIDLDTTCIFPGDANHDGVADATDIVAIAFATGQSGFTRADTSTRWYGKVCTDWGATLPNGRDFKHADSDASGTISATDTNAVARNFGFTHSKTSHTSSGLPIQLLPNQTTFTVGDVIELEVHVGDINNIATDILGLTYTVHSPSFQAQPGQVWISFPFSFMGTTGTDLLTLGVEERPQGQHHAGHGRISGIPATGMGRVATLHFQTDSINCPAALNTFHFSLSQPKIYLAGLVPEDLSPTPATVTVLNPNPVGGAEPLTPSLSIHPIPADEALHVAFSGTSNSVDLRILDLTGRELILERHRLGVGQISLPTLFLAEGTYLLQLRDAKGRNISRRFTVLHN